MDSRNKNTTLALSVFFGLLSLPSPWFSARSTIQVPGVPVEVFEGLTFPELVAQATGLNGTITMFFAVPIWMLIVSAIAASLLLFMEGSKSFAAPRALAWTFAAFAFIWTLVPIVVLAAAGKAQIEFGWGLGLVASIGPLVCLVFSRTEREP